MICLERTLSLCERGPEAQVLLFCSFAVADHINNQLRLILKKGGNDSDYRQSFLFN